MRRGALLSRLGFSLARERLPYTFVWWREEFFLLQDLHDPCPRRDKHKKFHKFLHIIILGTRRKLSVDSGPLESCTLRLGLP